MWSETKQTDWHNPLLYVFITTFPPFSSPSRDTSQEIIILQLYFFSILILHGNYFTSCFLLISFPHPLSLFACFLNTELYLDIDLLSGLPIFFFFEEAPPCLTYHRNSDYDLHLQWLRFRFLLGCLFTFCFSQWNTSRMRFWFCSLLQLST